MRYIKTFILLFLSAITICTSCGQARSTQKDSNENNYYSESESNVDSVSVGYILLKNNEKSADLYGAENGNIIVKMFSGDAVTVYSINAEWAKINYNGKDGYMKLENLSFSEPEPMAEVSAVSPETSSNDVTTTVAENTTDTATSGDFDDIHWELDSEGTLRISGTGLMPGTDYQSPWNDIKEKVKNIIIEEGVTSIGGDAFYDFMNLEAVLIPESVTSIGKYAFANCSKLQIADIPEGIEVIREGTFINCKNLQAIFFPVSLKTIETDAFKNDLIIGAIYHGGDATVQTLTKKIKFYSGNESITNTNAITVYPFNGMRYNSIEEKFYGQCGDNAYFEFKDGLFKMYGTGNTWSYDPFIPWDAILNEIETVVVEDGITSIGRMSFSGCENLTSVTLPDTLTLIEPFAFSRCSLLSSITIPASVTYIAFDAFDKESLKDIYYEGSESDWNNVKFYEIDGYELITDATIHFNSIGENATESNSVTASGKCGENASWEFSDGTLKISGSGEMEDYCDSNMSPLPKNSPWNKYSDEIKKVQIENGITSIGIGAIMNFPNLVDVEIANTVTYIQRWSFSSCPSLKSITLPESITNIGRESFGNCDNLASITVMNNKIYIENWCFSSCENLDVYFNGTEEEWKSTFQAMANSTLATANFNSIALQGDANGNGTN